MPNNRLIFTKFINISSRVLNFLCHLILSEPMNFEWTVSMNWNGFNESEHFQIESIASLKIEYSVSVKHFTSFISNNNKTFENVWSPHFCVAFKIFSASNLTAFPPVFNLESKASPEIVKFVCTKTILGIIRFAILENLDWILLCMNKWTTYIKIFLQI